MRLKMCCDMHAVRALLLLQDVDVGGTRMFRDSHDAQLFRRWVGRVGTDTCLAGMDPTLCRLLGCAPCPSLACAWRQHGCPSALPLTPQHPSPTLHSLLYEQYGIPFPAPGTPPPAVVTFHRKSSNRRVLNEEELLRMLAEFGEVRGAGPMLMLGRIGRRPKAYLGVGVPRLPLCGSPMRPLDNVF